MPTVLEDHFGQKEASYHTGFRRSDSHWELTVSSWDQHVVQVDDVSTPSVVMWDLCPHPVQKSV